MLTTLKLKQSKQKIDDLFHLIDPVDKDYFELYSHWAQYLVIKVSGFMEESLEILFSDYIESSASPKVAKYAKRQIVRSKTNPNHEKIKDILTSFDSVWGSDFEEFIKEEGRKDSLSSLINLRNNIAHGGTVNTSISRVQGYYEKCLEIIEHIESTITATDNAGS